MANRRQSRAEASRTEQIPQRVENAAQYMMNQAASGPRRGYIPQNTNRVPPAQGGWQQAYPQQNPRNGYYAGQNPQGPQQAYYGQQPVTGSQRGYVPAAAAAPRQQQAPKKKHTAIAVVAVVLVLALLGTGGYFGISHYMKETAIHEKVDPYDALFCPNVIVDGINLGGMTPEQAMNSVMSQIQQRHDAWKVQLVYNGVQIAEINADMLGFNVDPTQVLQVAWQQGHTGDAEQRYVDMIGLEQQPYYAYTAKPDGDTRVIDEKLAEIKSSIDTPATDAAMVQFDPSLPYPFVITDEAYGLTLDTEPIKEQLYRMVSTMESGTVEIVPTRVEPAVRKADVMKNYMLRSSRTTAIDKHSPENRNLNIQHAFDYINGYVLEPGKTFSFNKVVGERTEARGFLPAIEYIYGVHEVGVGGGVCQASTTLYQAAVCAGLQIVSRKPHSDSVSYADYGLDATVYWVGKRIIDFSFKNNTEGNIYIVAAVLQDPSNKSRLIAKVTMYGQDMGDVRYDMVSEEVEIIPAPFEPVYVKDTEGTYVTYKDQQESVTKAKEGRVVKSYRVRYDGTTETERVLLATDTYEPKPERIYVGVKDR